MATRSRKPPVISIEVTPEFKEHITNFALNTDSNVTITARRALAIFTGYAYSADDSHFIPTSQQKEAARRARKRRKQTTIQSLHKAIKDGRLRIDEHGNIAKAAG